MSHADFVHLRVHSAYSLSEGALKIDELIDLCRAERMPAVAVTDRGNLFGALEFALAAAKAGVQPIIGCELPVEAAGAADGRGKGQVGRDWLVLLAQNATGYANLTKLSSKGYLEGDAHAKPRVSPSDVEAHAEGLLALTGGPAGPVAARLGGRGRHRR